MAEYNPEQLREQLRENRHATVDAYRTLLSWSSASQDQKIADTEKVQTAVTNLLPFYSPDKITSIFSFEKAANYASSINPQLTEIANELKGDDNKDAQDYITKAEQLIGEIKGLEKLLQDAPTDTAAISNPLQLREIAREVLTKLGALEEAAKNYGNEGSTEKYYGALEELKYVSEDLIDPKGPNPEKLVLEARRRFDKAAKENLAGLVDDIKYRSQQKTLAGRIPRITTLVEKLLPDFEEVLDMYGAAIDATYGGDVASAGTFQETKALPSSSS